MAEPESRIEDSLPETGIQDAPTTLGGILRQLGPGLIVAGSIVGSGELIATTVTGAKAGFWLLWLIIIGCVIKVFVQVEMGRYSIVTGNTAMDGFVDVPGPRVKKRGNWLFWYWFIMFVVSIGQLGGIVGGVGQALSISFPITGYGKDFNQLAEARTQLVVETKSTRKLLKGNPPAAEVEKIRTSFNRGVLVPLLKTQAEKLETGHAQELQAVLQSVEADDGLAIALAEAHGSTWELTLEIHKLEKTIAEWEQKKTAGSSVPGGMQEKLESLKLKKAERMANLKSADGQQLESLLEKFDLVQLDQAGLSDPYDDEVWGAIITVITIAMLVVGRFTLIQNFSTALVAMFTLVTIVNLILLQSNPSWGFSLNDVLDGLKFQLPPGSDEGLTVALMAFGIIGVGANELVMYPYWCQEKGYGRFVGPNDGSREWIERAQGWMRVMRWDAWCSMVVYTFATVAFYLLGASILWRSELSPSGNDTIRYLAVMYEPVFGSTAQTVFLIGAFAVLYSTFFVANAAHARTFSDALRVIGVSKKEDYGKLVIFFSVFFPLCCILIYVVFPKPVQLVLVSGLMQALMLPMLAGAAIFYRYKRIGRELQPGICWDVFLWVSGIGMLIAGLWLAYAKIAG
mgnify:CR=1 FL=1